MKSIVVFYSYSGTTKKAAHILKECLLQKGSVELSELKTLDEPRNFFMQCYRAHTHVSAKIEDAQFDVHSYDLVCLGTPVWAFGPVPAVNAYLDRCSGIEGKDILLFSTYGSGTGNERCLNYMQEALTKKGAKSFKRFSLAARKIKNKELLISKIKEVI